MSVERRGKKSADERCKMSLLTGNRASFRADHHERSEVGGAKAEGLMIQERLRQGLYVKDVAAELGVHPCTVSRARQRGAAPAGRRPADNRRESRDRRGGGARIRGAERAGLRRVLRRSRLRNLEPRTDPRLNSQ